MSIEDFMRTDPSGSEVLRTEIEERYIEIPYLYGLPGEIEEKEREMGLVCDALEMKLTTASEQGFITEDQEEQLRESLREHVTSKRGKFIEELRRVFGAPALDERDRNNLRDELLKRISFQPPKDDPMRASLDLLVANALDTADYRATRSTARDFCNTYAKPRLAARH